MRKRSLLSLLGVTALAAAAFAVPAQAAGEAVNVWLTTTDDAKGVNVTRGLQQQTPISFTAGTGTGGQTINVNENTTYQQFEGAGASFTDSAAWLLNSSNLLSASTRNSVMQKLFDPNAGIGISFLRNPIGASDIARNSYTFDDVPAGQTDPNLAKFSIAHDQADVLPLTKQALQLNPQIKVMASPWSAPPWMKDNDSYLLGWVESQFYPAYAQYFVKYVQAYQAAGVPINYLTVQNEPTCCASYPSTNWNGAGLAYFTKTNLLPALHSAGLSTKVLALDWNWDQYQSFAAPTMDDAAIRNDPNFGGMAWHGYGGNVSQQTTVHNQYPSVNAYSTEHSGGTWVSNQQAEDMTNIVDYTRNWSRTVTKWSLAMDQAHNPHNGGCDTCTGLVTVHNGDGRNGQVDYTVEYYTMGHLTKFVKPGAVRIDSNDNATVRNVAWKNPDGSKALIAYNTSTGNQSVRVNWGGSSFTYNLPGHTSATFTWAGNQGTGGGGGTGKTGPITGLGGKCLDVASGSSANGAAVQLYDCNGSAAQQWTVGTDGTLRALGKCLDVTGQSTADGAQLQLWDCGGTANQRWAATAAKDLVGAASSKCVDVTGNSSANGTRLQIWTCTGAANQKWNVPA
ncbi:ricin-type beta-trefoil lectin domain protein [Amycolatopsis sp. WQ 127309]|uniref:ricin-type beta-trefoil lectin domain protein n=1 Tax=Amycolatopsis sp. WQ 127309 TaxID=2932773 RepID=UPI001FF1FF12|nr:ricin-type beta-trefoil lectin domain protein [Amycolatopsis sp. WQ 127309]UOZ08005.1 ricin-type beta-trefoil lectin domain protein [Amycolatopsis sp. WQ 127309]